MNGEQAAQAKSAQQTSISFLFQWKDFVKFYAELQNFQLFSK